MRKLFLITVILLLQSFPSFGEWKELGSTSVGVHFIEKDTIREYKELTYLNGLTDFFEPYDVYSSLSQVSRIVINCKSKKFRTIRVFRYLDSMGKGKNVLQHNSDSKKMIGIYFSQYSSISLFYKFVCK